MKKEMVRVELSAAELEKNADQLGKSEKSLSNAEAALDEAKTAWKGTQKALKAEVRDCREEVHNLARVQRDGSREEEIEVDERVKNGVIEVFNVKTRRTIRTKPIETGDQLTVPADDDAPDEAEESGI